KKDGTILGLRVRTVANVGAYLQAFAPGIPTILHVFIVPGPYRIPAFDYEMRGAYTNTTPVDAYRGAGRPEAALLIERIMDRLAPSKGNAALGVGWGGHESARIRVHATGAVQVFAGTSPHGQGHETSWAQIAADALGVSPNDIEVRHGDTFESPGMCVGTFGS